MKFTDVLSPFFLRKKLDILVLWQQEDKRVLNEWLNQNDSIKYPTVKMMKIVLIDEQLLN